MAAAPAGSAFEAWPLSLVPWTGCCGGARGSKGSWPNPAVLVSEPIPLPLHASPSPTSIESPWLLLLSSYWTSDNILIPVSGVGTRVAVVLAVCCEFSDFAEDAETVRGPEVVVKVCRVAVAEAQICMWFSAPGPPVPSIVTGLHTFEIHTYAISKTGAAVAMLSPGYYENSRLKC